MSAFVLPSSKRPWCAVGRDELGDLRIEVFTHDEARGWPDYEPPDVES